MTYALLTGNGDAIPGAAAASSFVSELMDRSPGARTRAELIKTKKLRSEMLSAAVIPKDNAIFSPLPAEVLDLAGPIPLIDIVSPADVLPTLSALLPAESSNPSFGGIGGGGIGLPGGGGGGANPPGTDTPGEPPVLSAVPEPSTWATMVFGFLLTGWALRRRPARKRWSPAAGKA